MIPYKIIFGNMAAEDAIKNDIEHRLVNLEKFYDHIISCDVKASYIYKRHFVGHIPKIQILLRVPGLTLIITKQASVEAHDSVQFVISEAFDAMTRRLEDYVRQRRGFKKHHEHEKDNQSLVDISPPEFYIPIP